MLCDESASIGCARVMRGIDSIANATTPRSASRRVVSGSVSGCRNAIRTTPSRSRAISAAEGFVTRTTASACASISAASTTRAPASVYAASR